MLVKIWDFVETSLVDVIESPAFVIWFSGCNFRCPWCHAEPLVLGEGKWVKISDIIEKIKENAYAIEYVQATGGEPTLQAKGLLELFKEVKKIGLKTSLDTNSSNPDVIGQLVDKNLIDHYATDIKSDLIPEKYSKAIGIKNGDIVRRITNTLRIIKKLDFVEIRTTFVPELISKEDVINGLSKVIQILDRTDFFFVLQQFYPFNSLIDKSFTKKRIISHQELVSIAKDIKSMLKIKNVYVRSKTSVEKV